MGIVWLEERPSVHERWLIVCRWCCSISSLCEQCGGTALTALHIRTI